MTATATPNPASQIIGLFNGYDATKFDSATGGGGWHPPKFKRGLVFLTGITVDKQGFNWDNNGVKVVKPTIRFTWEMADQDVLGGEFTGKSFADDQYIINNPNDPTTSDGAKKMQAKEMGRLKGILEVVTGQDVIDFEVSLGQAFDILTTSGGRFPLYVENNVWEDKKKKRENCNVYAIEAAPVPA